MENVNVDLNKMYKEAVRKCIRKCFFDNDDTPLRWTEIMKAVSASKEVNDILVKKLKQPNKTSEPNVDTENKKESKYKKYEYMVKIVLQEMSDELIVEGKGKSKRYSLKAKRPALSPLKNGPVELIKINSGESDFAQKLLSDFSRDADIDLVVIPLGKDYLLCAIRNEEDDEDIARKKLRSVIEEFFSKVLYPSSD